MKKLLTAALLFASVFAFAEGYEDWFTPPNKWEGVKAPVKLVANDEGSPITINFSVDIDDTLDDMLALIDLATKGLPESAKNAFKVSRLALANSLYASCQAHMNKLKIDNLGAALEGVFVSTYGQYVDEDGNVLSKSKSGVDTAKLRQQLLANKNAVVSGAKAAGGSENNPLTVVVTQKPYDEHQFEQHVANGRSLTSLHGWYGLSDDRHADGLGGADGWAFADRDYFIPYSNGKSSTLGWKKWNGWDSSCFSAGDDGGTGSTNDKTLHLKHWDGGDGGCGENLQNLLTNKSERIAIDRRKHYFLARYGENNAQTHDLHWVSMAESAMEVGGGDTEVDDHSVVTNESGQVALKGFEAAKPELAKDGAVLPFVDATSDDLQWTGIENFFSDSVFRKSSTTGKMLLNGTSEEGKVKVLAMTGSGGDDQQIAALIFDARSVDGGNGVVQVHGFDTAPSPFGDGVNFSDALTNTSVSVASMSVPLRVPASSGGGYEVKYAPLAKIAGIPAAAVDNTTIEVNESDPQNKFLQLHGAAGDGITLAEGDVYQIGSDGKGKFAKLGADSDIDAANASIESYTGDDGGKYFRLRDWMINREGIPHLLGWQEHALKYWTVDGSKGVDIDSQSGGEDISLSGYGDAADGAIPYALKDGNGLGWLQGVDGRVPLLHTDGAPTSMAIGASLDRANISAVPTLNVSGFTSGGNCNAKLNRMLSDPADSANRGTHQFMARYTGGGTPSVHWVSIDGVIAGDGGNPDGVTIVTNSTDGAVTDGAMSIRGFSTAEDGTTPVKRSNSIVWSKAASAIEAGSGITITTNGTSQVVSHNLVAGAGISITPASSGTAVTIASATPASATVVDPHAQELTFLTELWYDSETHQIKGRRITAKVMFVGTVPTAQEFVAVQCTPHSAEHESEGESGSGSN